MTKQIIIRLKEQFLFSFLLSFLTIGYIKPASSVKHKGLSQQSFSPFSFLSFFLSFLLLEKVSKSIHSFTVDETESFQFLFFLFWIHIIPIFRKGRRKNSLVVLIFDRTYFSGSFLLWTSDIPPRIGWISLSVDFCPKILFYAFYGASRSFGL